MSVYVDELTDYGDMVQGQARRYGTVWCHMWSDTLEELHVMADRIGLKRAWFQDKKNRPHYDLLASKRTLAIRYGAVEGSYGDWLRRKRRADKEGAGQAVSGDG